MARRNLAEDYAKNLQGDFLRSLFIHYLTVCSIAKQCVRMSCRDVTSHVLPILDVRVNETKLHNVKIDPQLRSSTPHSTQKCTKIILNWMPGTVI